MNKQEFEPYKEYAKVDQLLTRVEPFLVTDYHKTAYNHLVYVLEVWDDNTENSGLLFFLCVEILAHLLNTNGLGDLDVG